MSVSEAVRTRRSVREFLDRPVDYETIRRVLDTARWAPSGCNYQPWEATVLTGEPLAELREKLHAVDWTSSYFRKEMDVKVDWSAYARDRARMQGRAPGTGRRKRAS
mgnify:CR=1 FL=1